MEANNLIKSRIVYALIFIGVCFALLLFRLSWLQLVHGKELSMKAMEVRGKDLVLESPRGIIYDRNGVELVANTPVKSIYVNPDIFSIQVKVEEGENKEEKIKKAKAKMLGEMAEILELEQDSLVDIMNSGKSFVWIKHRVEYENYEKIKNLIDENKAIGIVPVDATRRSYPHGNSAAHVMGFVGMDPSARGGIERAYDSVLTGVPGRLLTETDGLGREVPMARSQFIPPVPGKNLVLTIDSTVQYYVENELDKLQDKFSPEKAIIVVMDPSSGEILGMGSRPGYQPSKYSSYPQEIWNSNPVVSYNYEPGSTMKMFLAAMALEEGLVRESDYFYDPGFIEVSGIKINCWDKAGHKDQTFAEGIQNSCNPVFISVGLKAGKAMTYKYLKGFGFGKSTGIDLPGEEAGLLIPEEQVSEIDLATISIGQSAAVTPIQLITAMSALANGGNLMKPYIVKSIEDPVKQEVETTEPQVIRQVISKETSGQMDRLLQKVVMNGTAKQGYLDGYAVAAKTGTAEIPIPGKKGYAEGKYVSSFAGFAPADNPKIAVLILLEQPKGGLYHGGEVAAPTFHTLGRDILQYLNIPENPNQPIPKDLQVVKDNPEPIKGERLVSVPNVIGFPSEEARLWLSDAGFKVDLAGQGFVVEQKPGGGNLLKNSSTVSIKAAQREGDGSPVIVPDLRGMTIKRAGLILNGLGFNVNVMGSGLVKSQKPAAGSELSPGSVITLEFAPPS